MNPEIIGRGTWIDKVAYEIINREKKLGRSLENIRTESGLGASGIPHVGSMADAVRAFVVSLALQDMGYNSINIAFSDDMDGLRRVPEGLPEWLENYLLMPVSRIPDPFGCHRSYGEHMSSLLREALDEAGIKYVHYSASEIYKKGSLKNEIHKILVNHEKVGKIIYEETGQEKYLKYLPYYVICENCGRIYTTVVTDYDPKTMKVKYKCVGAEIKGKWYKGCGHEGWAKIDRDQGKLVWKSEFAARWKALDVRFEAYGKDIADSVRVNDRIAREILGYEPPYHVRYEMFLDASGRKITKSRGNVFTPQVWYRYGSKESLILFLLKRFIGTRRVKLETIVNMMRELDYYRDIYHGRIKVDNPFKLARIRGLLEYTYKLGPVPPVLVPYEIILSLAEVAPEGKEREFITKRLEKYGYKYDSKEVEELITYAVNWVREVGRPPLYESEIIIDEKTKTALYTLIEKIKNLEKGEDIQGKIFETAREYGIPVKNFFKILYMILTGREYGPRLGPLIADIGVEKVIETIKKKLKEKE
jgi:lysyl-tRNA synthetase class 1